MKREELVKLEARLKLLGYSCDTTPIAATRKWYKNINREQNHSARLLYYIWIHTDSETGKELIQVEASGVTGTVINGYKIKTEFSSREKIDPEELEQEVKKIMESYRTLKLSKQ
ncbi:MAG: hypothetical protein IKW35_04400 [Paludibacteraceae bacterium]|nr:hypothetical protein [Paludibacteraceae bacterium]